MQPTAEQIFQHAFQAHQQGQLNAASEGYRAVLQRQPRNFDAWHMLGVAALQGGDFAAAAQAIERALQVHDGVAMAWQNLAAAYRGQELYAQAAHALARKLKLSQPDPATLHALADLHAMAGQHEGALQTLRQLSELTPLDAEAWLGQGVALRELNRPADALPCLQRALEMAHGPTRTRAASNLATALHELGHHDEALQQFDSLLAREPDYAPAHNARALTLWRTGRMDDADLAYSRAIELEPNYAEAWANRGALRVACGLTDAALTDLRRAVDLQPGRAETHNALGSLQASLRQFDAAGASYRRALELRPNFAQAHGNLGLALAEAGQLQAALKHYEAAIAQARQEPAAAASALANRSALHARSRHYALAASDARAAHALKADQPYMLGNALYFDMMQADWSNHEAHVAELTAALNAGHLAATPFVALTVIDDPALLLQTASHYAAAHFPTRQGGAFALPPLDPRPSPRIRLAWCSADFHNHATAFLIAGVLEHIDKTRFETVALSYGPITGDTYQRRLQQSFDRMIDVRDLGDEAIATQLRELQADIAIDLKGYTNEGRPGIFSQRSAAVQVSYLAYPGTLGLPLMDYVIADNVIVPAGDERHYSEAVVRLPDSYQANDARRAIAQRTFTRQELGLPEPAFVFCSFNNSYKITPAVFDVWMRLLLQVPGSVLWLLQDNLAVSAHLRREAQARGVSGSRLVFAARAPTDEHLARHAAADLFLDTWPVNAHTTASDALWAGLPMITLRGRSFASRVAASLLHAAGAADCVADDVAGYEALALAIAREPTRLAALRQRLQAARTASALFDTARYTRHLEDAFTQMHERARADLPPASFTVQARGA